MWCGGLCCSAGRRGVLESCSWITAHRANPTPHTHPNTDLGELPAWSTKLASSFSPQKFSPVILKSTRWPGATTIAYNDKFVNVYVGYGQREESPYTPKKLGEVLKEYGNGASAEENGALLAQLVEQVDPTVEQEAAYELEKRANEGGEGEEGAEGEGEGEEEDA